MLYTNKYSVKCLKKMFLLLPLQAIVLINFAQKPLKPLQNIAVNSQQTVAIKDNNSLDYKIISLKKGDTYNLKDKTIGYTLQIENKIGQDQIGQINVQVVNSKNNVLYKEILPILIKKKGKFSKQYVFDASSFSPGFYAVNMDIATNVYQNKIAYNFGYEVASQNAQKPNVISGLTAGTPLDFMNFWEQAKRELAAVPANYIVTPRQDLNQKGIDVYEVVYKSIDKATIYGWLTLPKEGNKNGVIYKMSDYLTELKPEFRKDNAVFCVNARGVGASNSNYNLSFDNFGIYNLANKNQYILKGVYMDCLRGLDFILQYAPQLKLNTNKIIATGSGLGAASAAAVAALAPKLRGVVFEGPTFTGIKDLLNFDNIANLSNWPTSMFKKFNSTNKFGTSVEAMQKTLEYFDPVNFAPYINCATLTGYSTNNTNSPIECMNSFLAKLKAKKNEKYVCKKCGNELDRAFYGFKEVWIKEMLNQP
jgi:cephalosporin-C deacetylase